MVGVRLGVPTLASFTLRTQGGMVVLRGSTTCAGLGGGGGGLGQCLGQCKRTALVHRSAPLDGREERGELGAVLTHGPLGLRGVFPRLPPLAAAVFVGPSNVVTW